MTSRSGFFSKLSWQLLRIVIHINVNYIYTGFTVFIVIQTYFILPWLTKNWWYKLLLFIIFIIKYIFFFILHEHINELLKNDKYENDVYQSMYSKLLKSSKKLRNLASTPELLGNKNYELCLNKYRYSLTEVSLEANQAIFSTIQRFSHLNKLHLSEISCRSITFYSLLDAISLLQELSNAYPLNKNHFNTSFPLKIYLQCEYSISSLKSVIISINYK